MGKAVGGTMGDDGPGSFGGIKVRALLCLGLMVLIVSSTAPAAKFAVRGLPLGLIPLARFGVAGLCLWPMAGRGGAMRRLMREDGWRLALAGALCVPINQAFFLGGASLTPSAHIGLIYAACPLVVLALATLIGQERLAPGRVLGTVATVLGVALIALENLARSDAAGRDALRGDLLEVGAVIAWGAYLTVNKPLIARHGALPVLAATFLVGAAIDLPVALITLPGWPPLASVPTSAWLGLAYLIFVVSVGGLAFQNLAMRDMDASQVASFGNVSPLLTIGWGYLLFGERITWVAWLGGGLVLLGIAWAARPVRVAPTASMVADGGVTRGHLAAGGELGGRGGGVELPDAV